MIFTTSADTAGAAHAKGESSAEFMSYINSATAYVNLTTLLGSSGASSLISSAKSNYDSGAFSDSTVTAGYKKIHYTVTDSFYSGNSGQVELLLSITSTSVLIQAALQHPLR